MIAAKVESIAAEIVERARQETALPPARLEGETTRICGQLRLFAQVAEEGSWVNARIDGADPEREPIPSPTFARCCAPWDLLSCSARATSRWRSRSLADIPRLHSRVGIP